jgi:hypothetical protein
LTAAGAAVSIALVRGSAETGLATVSDGEVARAIAAADDLAQQVLLVTIERLRAGEVRTPDEIGCLSDVTVRPGQREILNAFSAAHLRTLPATASTCPS